MPDREHWIHYYEQQIECDPSLGENYWQLGLLYFRSDDWPQAQLVWAAGLLASQVETTGESPGEMPGETQSSAVIELLARWRTEALTQQAIGRFDRAAYLYELSLELAPTPEGYELLGQMLAWQGQLDEALDCWQQAIEHDPFRVQPYRWQGQVWEALADWQQAVTAYQQALRLDWQPETAVAIGRCWGQLQNWAAASEILSEVRSELLSSPPFESQLDRSLSESLPHPQILISELLSDLSWMLLRQQKGSEAISQFQDAVWVHSAFGQVYCDWVDRLTQQGQATPEQLRLAALLSSLNPPDASAFVTRLHQVRQQRSQNSAVQPLTENVHPADRPIAYCETTQSWADSQVDSQADSTAYLLLNSAIGLPLKPPHRLDSELHFSFRFPPQIELPGAFVAQIPHGRFWSAADQSGIAVFTAQDQLLGDLSFEFPLLSPNHPEAHPSRHSVRSRALPPTQSIAGRVVVLAGLTNAMYFHWMLEVLPKLDLLRRSWAAAKGSLSARDCPDPTDRKIPPWRMDDDWQEIDAIVVPAHLPFQQETLAHLGVPAGKILNWTGELHLQADRLIVPSFPSRPAWMPPWACEFLRRSFLPNNLPLMRSGSGLRLYLSRQQAANRRMINELEVEATLAAYGFQTVYLEALAVTAQAALLTQADVVVAVHGSGLTNLVFCRPGTQVLELFSPDFVYPCYWVLSNCMQLEYRYLIGKRPIGQFWQPLFEPNPRLADLWIDRSELERILREWLGESGSTIGGKDEGKVKEIG
ncbi:MAG: glycosyltransferase 61 family protein [Elainella sp. Prado103]|nr:glycosyltransferase 61 family protein [Elainella sp. Prado103]